MKVKLNDSEEVHLVQGLTIIDGNTEFRIRKDNAGGLIINKRNFVENSNPIMIIPRVSNEIEVK